MTKMIKLSLAAAIAATGMSAAVVDNVKLSGNAKLFYETNNSGTADMFDNHDETKGQVIVNVAASASVGPITANVRNATITTLGLENAVVGDVQVTKASFVDNNGDTVVTHDGQATQNFTDIANLSATIGGTTLIMGKQELNTPMCFTEGWNVHRNTFEAGVLVNKGLIPNSTLIFADVKTTNANGANIHAEGAFNTDVNAEMAAISTSVAGLPVNAYYYDAGASSITWVDTAFNVSGVKVKAIFAEKDAAAVEYSAAVAATATAGAVAEVTAADATVGNAYAISAATKVAGLNVFAAYSSVSDDGQSFTNVATGKKTKLPTQAVYVDGQDVAAPGADTWKIKLSGMKLGSVNLAVQHVVCDNGTANDDVETDIIATTKIGGVAFKALLMQNEEGGAANKHEKLRVYANYSF